MKTISYRGRECVAVRDEFYVKRGPYTHGWIFGWELRDANTGDVVISGDPGQPRSSYEVQKARFRTKADLMRYIGQ